MGRTTGVEVLCHARERQPQARRVLMSGTLTGAMLKSESASCAHVHFEKPMGKDDGSRVLSVALGLGAP